MVNCRGCGKELAEDANFCPSCGLRTVMGEETGVKTPRDRPKWEEDVEDALQTAAKTMEEALRVALESLREVADQVGVEFEKVRERHIPKKLDPVFCPSCGAKNPGDSLYCTSCGKQINP
jgi:rRNA maturation endonuclease Nob1